jgi:hypothetical protein
VNKPNMWLEGQAPRAPLKLAGVGREPGHDRAVTVYFDRSLTDNELRAFHEFVRNFGCSAHALRDRLQVFNG